MLIDKFLYTIYVCVYGRVIKLFFFSCPCSQLVCDFVYDCNCDSVCNNGGGDMDDDVDSCYCVGGADVSLLSDISTVCSY